MHGSFYPHIKDLGLIENLYVFLPYIALRPFFPKTHFRDSLKNSKKNKSAENNSFFVNYIYKIINILGSRDLGYQIILHLGQTFYWIFPELFKILQSIRPRRNI
jgi:hypothetical protein